jgi:hypothetical protein
VDPWGNAHVVGKTLSPDFPTKDPLYMHSGAGDAFLIEINPTGGLIHSTYLGGSVDDRGNDVALDNAGDVWITGQMSSSDLPTVNPFQAHLKGPQDGFVAKIEVAKPPGEVISLNWSAGSKTTLEWNAVADAVTYNVYRGDDADLPKLLDSDVDSCLRLSTANLDSGPVLTEEPSAGEFHWYLVRAENAIGLGLPGSATAGPRIHDPSGMCP